MTLIRLKNPILRGFNPDPSILRVGDDYYIATSTFEWFPGVQIHHSKDLINWNMITRPLDTREHLDMIGNPSSGGIWAPCLSYSDGVFYLIFTDVKDWAFGASKDTHNYVTTATDIKGPWSTPVYLNSSGFDPSLFHDDDGRKWFINMEWDYRKQGKHQFSGILIQEYDPVEKKLFGPIHKIFKGTDIGLVEGPHIYKHNGYYYLATAEGGTSYEHAETVARSRGLFGPYEIHPNNPFITASNKDCYIQKTGHGSWCDTPDGRWYFVHLCGRPVEGTNRCVLGRETSIQEMTWKDDWPYLADGTNTPSDYIDIEGIKEEKDSEITYNFNNLEFLKDFQTLRIPFSEERFSINENKGYLRIKGKESLQSLHNQAIICRRQEDFVYEAETCMEFNPTSFQEMAGLLYRYNEANQHYLYVSYDENLDAKTINIIQYDNKVPTITLNVNNEILQSNTIYLRIKVNNAIGQFLYSIDGVNWIKAGNEFDTTILSDEYANPMGFTGAFIGMACQDMQNQTAYADFSYFVYKGYDEK